jgi:DNA repair exonuclease SbcCD nuclease subunit
VLDNDAFEIPEIGFKVIGGTMWTDFNRRDPLTMMYAARNMIDYKKIRIAHNSRRFTPEYCLLKHNEFKRFLIDELSKPFDGNTIVMTHHAPHRLSADFQHRDDLQSGGCYHSDLSELILDHPSIKYWVHGHMHSTSDYQIGDCRVIANPRGYHGIKLNDDFNENLVIALS